MIRYNVMIFHLASLLGLNVSILYLLFKMLQKYQFKVPNDRQKLQNKVAHHSFVCSSGYLFYSIRLVVIILRPGGI